MTPTTNEIDHITEAERKDLMGYCEKCEIWHPTNGEDTHTCGQKWSSRIGHQLTTKRSFNKTKR